MDTSIAQNVYLGDTVIKRIFYGDTMIYRDSERISFKDTSVFNACITFGSNNQVYGADNYLTYKQAADVSTVYKWFNGTSTESGRVYRSVFAEKLKYYVLWDNTTSNYDFPEFQYFTGLTSVEPEAFKGTGMKSIIIPESVKLIDSSAFSGAQALEYIKLPAGLLAISDHAFYYCGKLNTIVLKGTVPPILGYSIFGEDMVGYSIPDCSIIVPAGYGNVYRTDSNWSKYASMIKEINE